jgi:hypothetical protein
VLVQREEQFSVAASNSFTTKAILSSVLRIGGRKNTAWLTPLVISVLKKMLFKEHWHLHLCSQT